MYTQALIHSNLFNTHLTQNGELNFMFFSCYLYVFYMYYLCICIFYVFLMFFICIIYVFTNNTCIRRNKVFRCFKYFFRLSYTSGVQSVPVCAVQWIHFNVLKDSINCSIGHIEMKSWHELIPHQILKNKPFIAFLDLLPSRFACHTYLIWRNSYRDLLLNS